MLISLIFFIPLFCAFYLLINTPLGRPNRNSELLGLFSSILVFFLLLLLFFRNGFLPLYSHNLLFNISFECDGISLSFLLLTGFITPIAILSSERRGEMIASILIVESLLFGAFIIMDFIWFFILFESVLIPMYFLIGFNGSGLLEFRIQAAYRLFLYTLAGSIFMLIAIVFLYIEYGSTHLYYLQGLSLNPTIQFILFPLFFLGFAVKIPLLPLHLWLPKAHVEAPTCGSIILAALLLKLGGYGLIRWLIPLCPIATKLYAPYILILCVLGIIFSSLTTLRQTDLKKFIAYSSIAHMAYVVLGIFSLNQLALEGAILQMINHGLVSAGLFGLIGNIYNRYGTRIIKYYRGLTLTMPNFSILFFLFTLANISVPLTGSFISEFLILAGCFQYSPLIAIIAALGIILGASYGIWLYNRLCFGTLTNHIIKFKDLTRYELYIYIPLLFFIFFFGLYPSFLLDIIHYSVSIILIPYNYPIYYSNSFWSIRNHHLFSPSKIIIRYINQSKY